MAWLLDKAYEWSADYCCTVCGYPVNISDEVIAESHVDIHALPSCPHCGAENSEIRNRAEAQRPQPPQVPDAGVIQQSVTYGAPE